MNLENTSAEQRHLLTTWTIIAVGFMAMFVPTFTYMTKYIWSGDQQGQGPIVLAITIWLFWKKRADFLASPVNPSPKMGIACFSLGLLLYVIGRTQDVLMFEVGSSVVLIAALILLTRGSAALKTVWFSIFFMMFMIPMPSAIVDSLTQPIKIAVSYVSEYILYHAGYPISRTGVLLQIGQYQLLIADACAGLNTLFTLEAIGLLYLNLIRHESAIRNLVLAIFIVPISFAANVIRVITLTLITYYLGDEAGQGFLHGFSGMVLFLAALGLIMALDKVLRLIVNDRNSKATPLAT